MQPSRSTTPPACTRRSRGRPWPPSRPRSRGRCHRPHPGGPGQRSRRPSPTSPGRCPGAPGSRARGPPGSPAPSCPAGCSWPGPERGHCCLCPPESLEVDTTHEQSRQGPGGRRHPSLPICAPPAQKPFARGDLGPQGARTGGALTPAGPAQNPGGAVGPAPGGVPPHTEPCGHPAQRTPGCPRGDAAQTEPRRARPRATLTLVPADTPSR